MKRSDTISAITGLNHSQRIAFFSLLTLVLFLFTKANAQPLSVSITSTNVVCGGENTGTATATAMGGIPPYTYFWSTWEMTPTINNLYAWTYDVTITDDVLSTVSTSVTIIEENPPLYTSALVTYVSCYGDSDGSITAEAEGGEPPYQFNWSNGSTDPMIFNLSVGDYWLTVSDDNACSSINYYYVGQPAEITIELVELNNEICLGAEDGSITISVGGGNSPLEAEWSNGLSGLSISDLGADTYTVTVTDNNDCTETATYTINPGNAVEVSLLQIQDVLCYGGSTGSISIMASEGNAPYSYNWSNGYTGTTINNLPAEEYTVTVNDDDNCTATANYEIVQPPDLVIDLEDLQSETCSGSDDGSIIIEITGGVNPYLAQWSNGTEGLSIFNLAPGFYSVTATDDAGCLESETFEINPGNVIQANLLEAQNISCQGGSNGSLTLSASGGNSPYMYLWSNGMSGPVISGLTVGTYTTTVTDAFGCANSYDYTLSEPSAISISISQPSQNPCFGDTIADLSANATGGISPYAALWSDGTTGMENTNLEAGTYTISITDANSCLANQSITITDPVLLTTTISTTNETAFGANDGTATASVTGGFPVYSYAWSNGGTTSTITNLAPGSYTVTVNDMNNCTVSGAEQVLAFGCLLDVMSGMDYSICEDETSIIAPLVTGATGAVSYLWTDSSTTESLEVTQGGEYCVTVTDAGNCQNADCIIITEIVIPPFTCPVINESTMGANDGVIQCDSMPGNVMYVWSNGATTSSIEGLSPGEYCVTITDSLGCSRMQCFNVQPANCLMSYTSTVNHVSCYGQATGSINLSVSGGTEPVTYTWSNGSTSASIDDLISGNYTVTITDAAGCIDNGSFTITEPLPITITVDSVANADETGSGLIWVTVSGGTPGYDYQWVDPSGGIHDSEDLNGLMISGYYFLEVTDTAGCVVRLDSVFVDRNVAVEHLVNFKPVKIYPVPTRDELFIDLGKTITEIEISGVDGRLCLRLINPGSNKINVSDLESGWYFIRVFDGQAWYVARMVK